MKSELYKTFRRKHYVNEFKKSAIMVLEVMVIALTLAILVVLGAVATM